MALPKFAEHLATDSITQGQAVTLSSHWRTATLVTIVALIVVLCVFWQTVSSMVATWRQSDTFAHGFLVLPISLYLIWTRRRRVAPLVPAPNFWGLPLLAGLGFGWLLANLANVLVVQQFTVVAMLPGLVWTVLGTSVTRALLFPLAFLFFAVPVGEVLVPPLQDFTALFTVRALELSGIPVFWEGRFIEVPGARWEVAEACSGVRYVIPSVVLGCLYANVTYQSWIRRAGFILLSGIAPILANGLRAYGIVVVSHLSDGKIAAGVDHIIYGWVFFGIVMFLLFWLGARWGEPAMDAELSILQPSAFAAREKDRRYWPQVIALTAAGSFVVLTFVPVLQPLFSIWVDPLMLFGGLLLGLVGVVLLRWSRHWCQSATDAKQAQSPIQRQSPVLLEAGGRSGSWARALALAASGGVIVLTLAPISARLLSSQIIPPRVVHAVVPSVSPPWKLSAQDTENWVPRFVDADAEVLQSYSSGDQQVQLYIASYASERQGAELINSENTLFDRQQWVRLAERQIRALVNGHSSSVHETVIRSVHSSRLVWSWYWIGGEWTANPYHAKLLQLKAQLFGGPQGAAGVALSAKYTGQQADAANALQDFLNNTSFRTLMSKKPLKKGGAV